MFKCPMLPWPVRSEYSEQEFVITSSRLERGCGKGPVGKGSLGDPKVMVPKYPKIMGLYPKIRKF